MGRVEMSHDETNETTGSHSEDEDEEACPGKSCCVFPLILAFMLGALFRQAFQWFRTRYFTSIPPYTVFLVIVGGGFAQLVKESEHWSEQWKPLKAYDQCLNVSGKTLVHVSLPLLVFQPTFKTEMQTFKKAINQVLFLAVTGYAMVVAMTTVVMQFLFFRDWTLYSCIIFGLVVCATDPLAVDDAVKVSGVSVDLANLLQGESIIGGAMGMLCFKFFRLLLSLSLMTEPPGAYKEEITIFVVQCLFAPCYGVFAAMMTVFWVSRIYNDATLEITIVLSIMHLVYYSSELLRLPGVLTVLCYGLYLSSSRASISHTVEATMKKSFRVLSDIHNSVLYFYAGVFIVNEGLYHYSGIWFLYDILIWVLVNVNRAIMVFFVSPVLRRLGLGMSWEHTLTVWIAGLNGSFNILLAMMASEDFKTISKLTNRSDLDTSTMLFQSAMSIILLRQIVNTSLTRFVLKVCGLRSIPKFHQMSLATAMRRLEITRNQTLNSLKSDRFMADAAFDVVESETQTDDMFKQFRQKEILMSNFLKKLYRARSSVHPHGDDTPSVDLIEEEAKENKAESIQLMLKAQKKTYWELFDRGLMSKEAHHQLIEWADYAADHKGRYLDVRKVKEACQVRPFLKALKRQVKMKLRILQRQKESASGWLYWQQQVLQSVLGYGFHMVDTVALLLAVVFDVVNFKDTIQSKVSPIIFYWNCVVVGLYGMIALGELLVMRLRFFKIVWHDITLIIVVMGCVDLLVMSAVGGLHLLEGPNWKSRLFIRLVFILSRSVRLLAMVENVPWVLRKLGKVLEQRISGHLGVGFDICCAYVTGQGEVIRQMEQLVSEPAIRQELKRTCNKHKMDIIRTLGTLALENPTIALSVKTRQSMRIVLNAQHDTVKQLKEEGAIQDTDASLLSKDLEERMKRLLNSPPLVEDDSQDSILKNIGWVQGDDDLFEYLKDNMEISHLKANSVVSEQDTDDFNVYIIGSGVARLERMSGAFSVAVLDYLTTGNVFGEIHFLTKAVRNKTVRCETAVTVLTLKEEVMEKVLRLAWAPELPPVLYRMWLGIAKRVAIKVIMDDPDYLGMSMEQLRMQMYNGYLIDDRLGTSISIHADPSDTVILIHGHARDAFTRQPFTGPCFIPRNCFQLQLMPEKGLYTLLLVIPSEPIELEEYCINPVRRSSQVDASILALSASGTDAMHLQDLYANAMLGQDDLEASRRSARATTDPDNESMSDTSAAQSEMFLLSDTGMAEQKTSIAAKTHEREIIVPNPSGSSAVDTSKLREKKRSHMPEGAAWQMSDSWDQSEVAAEVAAQMVALESRRNTEFADQTGSLKSSESEYSSDFI